MHFEASRLLQVVGNSLLISIVFNQAAPHINTISALIQEGFEHERPTRI